MWHKQVISSQVLNTSYMWHIDRDTTMSVCAVTAALSIISILSLTEVSWDKIKWQQGRGPLWKLSGKTICSSIFLLFYNHPAFLVQSPFTYPKLSLGFFILPWVVGESSTSLFTFQGALCYLKQYYHSLDHICESPLSCM